MNIPKMTMSQKLALLNKTLQVLLWTIDPEIASFILSTTGSIALAAKKMGVFKRFQSLILMAI
jgi:hypothetical protein